MKVVGIVAEYNPFHKGHAYQINYARKTLGADYIIAVMSGPFTQRGLPAVFDKYSRAQAAVRCDVDMVLELPVIYATGSAERFAEGAISLLVSTGIVDTILFGCETPDMEQISRAASILLDEPEAYKTTLQHHLANGYSFAKARAMAMEVYGLSDILDKPNNILAVEYVKALQKISSDIKPVCMPRSGADYHDEDINVPLASATAIRANILADDSELYMTQVPEVVADQYHTLVQTGQYIAPDDVSSLLHYALLSEDTWESYLDCSHDLSNKIRKNLSAFVDFTSFCDVLKSKETTHSRITRVMNHILLHITEEGFQRMTSRFLTPYLRILCANKAGSVLFSEIKMRGHAQIITSPKESCSALSAEGQQMLALDTFAADVYRSLLTGKTHQQLPNEFTRKFTLLS